MKIKRMLWQNVTEGFMTDELKEADIVLLSEAKPWRTRRGRGIRRTKQFRNRRLKGLVINWDKSEFVVVETGSRKYHNSGKAEGWYGIRTPARGIIWVVGYWKDDPEKELYFYAVTHWLNSWMPMKFDKFTNMRSHIVRDLTIPVVESTFAMMERRKKIKGGIFGGDTNSLRWAGKLKHAEPIDNRGLDRTWKIGDVDVEGTYDSPKTGVGPQLKHEGTGVKQKI